MARRIISLILYIIACACVVVSIVLLLVTAALLVSDVAVTLRVAPLALDITRLLPDFLQYWSVISSPFGGVFRTDFAVVALVFFILAALIRRIARRVKK